MNRTSLGSVTLTSSIWSPYVAGSIIGLSQIIAAYSGAPGLGTSSSFVTCGAGLCSLVAPGKVKENSYLSNSLVFQNNLFQPAVVSG